MITYSAELRENLAVVLGVGIEQLARGPRRRRPIDCRPAEAFRRQLKSGQTVFLPGVSGAGHDIWLPVHRLVTISTAVQMAAGCGNGDGILPATRTVQRWAEAGRITAVKPGSEWLTDAEEVVNEIEKRRSA